ELARFQAAGQGDGLVAEGLLRLRKQLGDIGCLLGGGILVALLLGGLGDDLLFALRDLRLLIAASASAPAASAAHLLRLREFTLEGVGLDEDHVGVGFGVGILGGGVD